jgi:hypothetical protein
MRTIPLAVPAGLVPTRVLEVVMLINAIVLAGEPSAFAPSLASVEAASFSAEPLLPAPPP